MTTDDLIYIIGKLTVQIEVLQKRIRDLTEPPPQAMMTSAPLENADGKAEA